MKESTIPPRDGFDHAHGAITRGARAVLIVFGVVVAVNQSCACGPVRNGLATITPTVPRATPCTDGAQRCVEGRPESCRTYDGVTRWWPLTPLDGDGGPARCAVRCVVDGEPLAAHCAGPVDASDAGAER